MHLANAVQIVTADSLDVIAANLTDALPPPPIQNSSDAPPLDRIATVLDAKRGQFYVAVYERIKDRQPLRATGGSADYEIPAPDDCLWQKIVPDCLITARELIDGFAGDKPIGLLGDGLLYHREKFSSDGVRILDEAYWSPRASKVHALGYQKAQAGLFADPVTLTPFYLRGPQVTLKKKS
jgi:tRNA A37 threonylcarbamoyladenosine modification protein TsaB